MRPKHSTAENLPDDLRRERVITFAQGCELAGVSTRQARRLIAQGHFPKPIRLGARYDGLIVGEILDHIQASRAA